MKIFKAIILDDENDAVELLKLQISKNCPQINVIASHTNSVDALNDIEILQPDLLFIDIEMPIMDGFEVLKKLMPFNFAVVFITAYNQYAIKAFKFNALDYLVKPIDTPDLIDVVNRFELKERITNTQLNILQKQIGGEVFSKIAIPTQKGVTFIDLKDIIYVEASNNYSKLILNDGKVLTISKTLKDLQDFLLGSYFFRIHRQYIINLKEVKHFNRTDSILTMTNKAELPVSRNQKENLVEMYKIL